MTNQVAISVIIPCFNAEKFIKNCLDDLHNQNFEKDIEIIIIDDASEDKTVEIIKSFDLKNLRFFPLKQNSGPAAARNLGLKKAVGKYVFFLDVDDKISPEILKCLYYPAIEKDLDMVFCDKQLIERSTNQRENIFYYSTDRLFEKNQITNELLERFTNPFSYSGIFLHYGKLIKRSLLVENNIFFVEELRYLEDEVFGWDTLAFVKNVAYIRKQLYLYYINPKTNTARSEALNKGFPISNFFLIKDHIKKSLKKRNLEETNSENFSNHAFAYFIINSLVSYNMSIFLEKIDSRTGKKNLKNFVKELINNKDIINAFKNYKPSKNESRWIPKAILTKSIFLIKLACNMRCKEILRENRRKI